MQVNVLRCHAHTDRGSNNEPDHLGSDAASIHISELSAYPIADPDSDVQSDGEPKPCADPIANPDADAPSNATADILDAERFSDPFANPVAGQQQPHRGALAGSHYEHSDDPANINADGIPRLRQGPGSCFSG